MSPPGSTDFSHAVAAPLSQTMRRTRRSNWMLSAWFKTAALSQDGGGTACMALGCPADFVAVRLGFPNVAERPWRMTRVIARASSSFNDYVKPTGDAPWTTLTAGNAGKDSSEIVSGSERPHEIEVHGLGEGEHEGAARVRWTWTDWVAIRSLCPDPATGMRVLMLRALVPSAQTVTFANGQLRRFIGDPAVNLGCDLFAAGGIKFNQDIVTDPNIISPWSTQTWLDNHLVPGTMFPLVQFLTVRPGISGMAVGDSHAQGTSTTEQFRSYGYCANASLINQYRDTLPFSMANCALGGLRSETFFARFVSLMEALRPSYALLPGWTYNDQSNNVHADQAAMDLFLARLLNAAETCQLNGVLPIILTPFPRDRAAMTPTQLGPWLRLRETLMQLRSSGAVIADATPVLGQTENGEFDGTYLPSMSVDQAHPNNEGHAAVGALLADIIRSHL